MLCICCGASGTFDTYKSFSFANLKKKYSFREKFACLYTKNGFKEKFYFKILFAS